MPLVNGRASGVSGSADTVAKNAALMTDSIDFHSFRHTFKDAARACGMPEGLQRQIMGHSAKDVADSYGSGFTRKSAHDWIARVRILGMPKLSPIR